MEPVEGLETTKAADRVAVFAGPFRWLVLAHGFAGLAFWGYFGTVFAQATFRFGAGTAQMAVLGASLSVPFILGSLLQGLVVDRWSPKWLLFIGDLILAGAVPVAWAAGSLAWLYVSSFMVGAAFATTGPARSALTSLLVPKNGLVRANGAIAVSFQLSLVVGTFGGGALLRPDASGTGAVYGTALATVLLSLAFALFIPDVRHGGERPEMTLSDLRVGARTAWHHTQLRLLLLVTGLGWTLVNVFFVLEPIFVKTTLHRGQDAVLFLWGAHGAGALAGAATMTRSRRGTGREAMLVCAGVALVGTGILVYAGVGVYAVALGAAAFSGLGFALLFPPLLALIQRVVREDQRGRVTSVFVALQETMGLVSSLALIALAGIVVVRPTIVVSGGVLAAMGLLGLRAARAGDRVIADDEPAG